MKVGDLVRCIPVHDQIIYHDYGPGVIVMISRTGRSTFSAQVKFMDPSQSLMWFDFRELEVISEGR